MSRRGWILFIALSVLWGIPYLLIRVAVDTLDPVVVAFARTAIGGLLLLPVALYRRELMVVLRRWRLIVLFAGVEIIGPWWLLPYAETRLDSSTAGLLVAGVPLVTAVILFAAGKERIGAARIIGLLIGLGGVAALVGFDIDLSDGWALLATLGVVTGYSVGAYMMGHMLQDLPPMGVITSSLLISATAYLPFAIWLRPTNLVASAVWSVLGLAVLATAGGFLVMFALVAKAGAARATVVTYLNTVVAIVLGVVLLSEPLTTGILVGFPLVILGAVLATSKARATDTEIGAVLTAVIAENTPDLSDAEPSELDPSELDPSRTELSNTELSNMGPSNTDSSGAGPRPAACET